MSSKLNVNRVRDLLQVFAFHELFIEELGWIHPATKRAETLNIQGQTFTYKGIALLGGIEAFEILSATGAIPDRTTQAAVSKEIAKVRLEHVLIFVDSKRTQSVWYWVKRDGAKRYPREHHFFRGQPGDLFISKIASMSVDLSELDETGQFPLLEAANRVRRALDVERVIKRFYGDFDTLRVKFTELIKGIPDERDRRWYASVLLNRLMFIYFLQGKGFMNATSNQSGDFKYLENKLTESKQRGADRYYSEFLQALFFEAFAKPEDKRTKEARELTGRVKYLNGGLFLPHKLEQEHSIEVPDDAFSSLFTLFGRYSWNLNDIPGESDDDINPDVLGYIFEKYINQKEFGAYYTRPQITEYLCEQTIYQLILDRVSEPDLEGLPPGKHFSSVPELLIRLDRSTARKLLHEILPELTILDPAVGSGAFLVAALKTLITVYSAVIGWLEFNDKGWLEEHLAKRYRASLDRKEYLIKKAIITDNLYGVDLMEEATEIAKLRLFMTLVASAQTVDELEPLPNIDFNILAGNSLIGLLRVEDAEYESKQQAQTSLFAPTKTYRQILSERNLKVDQYRHSSDYVDDLGFLRDEVDKIEAAAEPVLGALMVQKFEDLEVKFEEPTWDIQKDQVGKPKKRPVTSSDIRDLEPFHWGFEFDRILNQKGGFDAIITNPPWETLKPQDKEFFMDHSDLVSKKKMTITEFDLKKNEFLKDPKLRQAYFGYLGKFPHQSAYFRSAPDYANQSADVGGKRTGTDINLYKLFTERCYNLLQPGGLCGIVIPSGLYSDLGTTGLRRMLFEKTSVTGLFCFENRKEIFEGVHRSFKFVVLSYRKGGVTKAFPAAFMQLEVDDLARFPESVGVSVSLETIRSLSPETLSVMEIKGQLELDIAMKMARNPSFGTAEGLPWSIRLSNEIHMTNDKALFEETYVRGRLPLFEGKLMHQFDHRFSQPTRWIDEKRGRKSVLGRIPDTGQVCDYQRYRLAHRAIASSTNERTLIATILPKNVFYGNSLYASRNPQNGSIELLAVALLNSFTVDYYLRQIVSANLNLNFIYQLPIPRLTAADVAFAPIVRRAARLVCTTEEFGELWNEVDTEIGLDPSASSPKPGACRWSTSVAATASHDRSTIRSELDGLVAALYELSEEEFRHVLSTFPLVDPAMRDSALAAYRSVHAGRIS